MRTEPFVSVLMTAYNREKYIEEAIKSVLASTYKSFELIIVDDKSTDGTISIIKNFVDQDDRIKLYINEQNLGDYPNRNKAASYAKGKYIKYVDADDQIYPFGLEIMVRAMEKFPQAALGIGNIKDEEQMFPFLLAPKQVYRRFYLEKKRSFGAAPLSTIIRADIFREVGGFSGKRMVGDFELWHVLGAKYPIVFMQGGLTWHRTHDEQEMTIGRKDLLFNYKYLDISHQMLIENSPLNEEISNKLIQRIKKAKARLVFSSLLRKQYDKAWQIYRLEKLTPASLLYRSFL